MNTLLKFFILISILLYVFKPFAVYGDYAGTSCNGCGQNFSGGSNIDCSCACLDKFGCHDRGAHASCDKDQVGCPSGISVSCNACADNSGGGGSGSSGGGNNGCSCTGDGAGVNHCSWNNNQNDCQNYKGCNWSCPSVTTPTPTPTPFITYPSPTPSPTPIGVTPTPTPIGYTPTPSPTPSPHGYFPGWFKTENGDVHSNKDIIVSLPSLLERFATYLVTTNYLSSFAAGSNNDARPELASTKNWYWYTPPYGTVTFPENAGFYSYYTHNKPPDKKIVADNISMSLLNANIQSNKVVRLQIDSTINTVSVNENINLSGNQLLIIYINGDLNVNSNINLQDNSGLIFIVNGNLNVAPTINQADGFYLVDKTVNSTDGSGAGGSLIIHGGIFVSANGKIFGTSRQIHDSTTPSEKIVYEPKYLVEFGQSLGHEGIIWREVAP